MVLKSLDIRGAWIFESTTWSNDRRFFREWFKSEEIKNTLGREFGIE